MKERIRAWLTVILYVSLAAALLGWPILAGIGWLFDLPIHGSGGLFPFRDTTRVGYMVFVIAGTTCLTALVARGIVFDGERPLSWVRGILGSALAVGTMLGAAFVLQVVGFILLGVLGP